MHSVGPYCPPAAEVWIALTSRWRRPGRGQRWTRPTGRSPGDGKETAHTPDWSLPSKICTFPPLFYMYKQGWRLIFKWDVCLSRFHVSCAWGASVLGRPAWQRAPTGKVCRASWWPPWIRFCYPPLSWKQEQTWTAVHKTSADQQWSSRQSSDPLIKALIRALVRGSEPHIVLSYQCFTNDIIQITVYGPFTHLSYIKLQWPF